MTLGYSLITHFPVCIGHSAGKASPWQYDPSCISTISGNNVFPLWNATLLQ